MLEEILEEAPEYILLMEISEKSHFSTEIAEEISKEFLKYLTKESPN